MSRCICCGDEGNHGGNDMCSYCEQIEYEKEEERRRYETYLETMWEFDLVLGEGWQNDMKLEVWGGNA